MHPLDTGIEVNILKYIKLESVHLVHHPFSSMNMTTV